MLLLMKMRGSFEFGAKPYKISSSIQEGSGKKVNTKSSWEQSVERLEKAVVHDHEGFSKPGPSLASKERNSGLAEKVRVQRTERSDYGTRYGKFDNHDDGEVGDGEIEEAIDDPRWDNIKNRKTWKEATESTVPKIVGEGIYGVGPVLAALSAERREFYALYVQEGLDLSSNNRKKKDKKGFEKVLKIVEKSQKNTRVAEADFPIKVEDFFRYFFSDDAVNFHESFHKRCGDKDFKCSSWRPQEKFGYARELSFQHPIRLYLGAKFGGSPSTTSVCCLCRRSSVSQPLSRELHRRFHLHLAVEHP
ncbi:Protein VASCULAR ASSOCIATED DEATH 1 [Arachis hypogaea]|nr:Protein VASCULAR ASSOCIATED DEATH 1 [Arachis hypogaea]